MNPDELFLLHHDGRTLIVEVRGAVSSLADDTALQSIDHLLAEIEAANVHDVIVDFQQSPYFGSCLLETLREMWRPIHARGGRMVLCNLSPVGLEIIQLAKFDQLWPVTATRDQAVQQLEAQG